MRKFLLVLFLMLPMSAMAQNFTDAQWKAAVAEFVPAGKCWGTRPGGSEGWLPCTATQRLKQEGNTRAYVQKMWNAKYGAARNFADAPTSKTAISYSASDAQEVAKNAPTMKTETAMATVATKDEKKAPDTIPVADVRRDKVKLLQLEDENFQLKKQVLLNKLTESPEWVKLDTPHKDIGAKLQAELVSTLKAAGVEEKSFSEYEYDRESMTFRRKAPTVPVVAKP